MGNIFINCYICEVHPSIKLHYKTIMKIAKQKPLCFDMVCEETFLEIFASL